MKYEVLQGKTMSEQNNRSYFVKLNIEKSTLILFLCYQIINTKNMGKKTKAIEARVEYALQDFTRDISDKKFKKHVKKAGKILKAGLELPSTAVSGKEKSETLA